MKKFLYLVACLLEALLIAGSYVFHYFTRSKMGMARFVIFKNQSWLAKYPLEQWKLAAVCGIVALTVLAAFIFWRKRSYAPLAAKVDMGLTAAMSCAYVGFTLFYSLDKLRAYYFVSLMLGLAAFIQAAKLLWQVMGTQPGGRKRGRWESL